MNPKTESEMDESALALRSFGLEMEIERAKHRCRALIDRILTLPPNPSHPSSSSSSNRTTTLLRLAHSELSFLSRLSIPNRNPNSLSFNIGHLEAVVHILHQPFINGVSRVCKPISLSPLLQNGQHKANNSNSIHVDIVCTVNGNPVWFLVSARNPKHVSWNGSTGNKRNKSLRARIQQLLDAAEQSSPTTKPSSIILFFANGLDDNICRKLEDEFGASRFGTEFPDFEFDFSEDLEGEWVHVLGRSYGSACVLEIKVDHLRNYSPKIECGFKDKDSFLRQDIPEECNASIVGGSFCRLVSRMKLCHLNEKDPEFAQRKELSVEGDSINFDTTALIALVSGISNGGTETLLAKPESELRRRFKSNYEFVIAQVMSEIQHPIHVELDGVLSGKRGMICESVCSEFKDLVSMCGGPNEKSRADHLLKCLMVVPDSPSARMLSLPTTRKLALKNKVVFGTGDYWRAPTLTANMAFVRAISQTGMSLFTIEHRPRALTGD